MVDAVKNNLDKIIEARKEHHIQSLYSFGSAAREIDFTEKSDIDFLVQSSLPINNDAELYFKISNGESLLEKLQSIVERKVDLVQEQNIRNKYLRHFINKDKKLLYGISQCIGLARRHDIIREIIKNDLPVLEAEVKKNFRRLRTQA